MDIKKETTMEYIENLYALGINKYSRNKDYELKVALRELETIEDKIRKCKNLDELSRLEILLNSISNRIEVLIHE